MNKKIGKAVAIAIGLAAAGIYVGETDDAPGAALLGILLAVGLVVYAIRIARQPAANGVAR